MKIKKLIKTKKGKSVPLLLIMFALIQGMTRCKSQRSLEMLQRKTGGDYLPPEKYMAHVTKVVDGDTIDILFMADIPPGCKTTERVRLIGINCPELNEGKEKPAEYYAKDALRFTNKELNDQYVELQFDNISEKRDRYGRIICYVWVGKHLFNRILVERGFARFYDKFKFNTQHMKTLAAAEKYALDNRLGLWESTRK